VVIKNNPLNLSPDSSVCENAISTTLKAKIDMAGKSGTTRLAIRKNVVNDARTTKLTASGLFCESSETGTESRIIINPVANTVKRLSVMVKPACDLLNSIDEMAANMAMPGVCQKIARDIKMAMKVFILRFSARLPGSILIFILEKDCRMLCIIITIIM
jgi:hypothetical protein